MYTVLVSYVYCMYVYIYIYDSIVILCILMCTDIYVYVCVCVIFVHHMHISYGHPLFIFEPLSSATTSLMARTLQNAIQNFYEQIHHVVTNNHPS